MSWYVYVLYSNTTGRLYTGISTNVDHRLAEHNAGTGAAATRAGRPWKVVHVEPVPDKSTALKREYEIKQMPVTKKWALVGLS